MIFWEQEAGQNIYIVKIGSVKLTNIINDSEIVSNILKVGDFFGELPNGENSK